MKKIFIIIIIILVALIWYQTIPPQKESELVTIEVERGDNYHVMAEKLQEEGLIRSAYIFKVYIYLNRPDSLQAGLYELDKNWSIKKITEVLGSGATSNNEVVFVTIPEGRNLKHAAGRVAAVINSEEDEILSVWNSEEFINEVIEKYDFINEEVKNNKIIYPLEGYLFPDTYELLNVNVSPQYVAFRMLDKMNVIYRRYQSEIEAHEFSFHEILTLASIVEHEAILDEDRPKVASVFFNRLDINWRLESCATLGYAIGEWKINYSNRDQEVDHPYNTYKYFGLPPGPGNMPGEKSIQAVLNPADTNYRFFRANVCDETDNKTYFSKTLDEHRRKPFEENFDLSCY